MHISTLHLYTYSPNTLINGTCKIDYEGGSVNIELSEADRMRIQQICVDAYISDRQRIADQLLSNTPALVALEPPRPAIEDAEFTEVDDHVPF